MPRLPQWSETHRPLASIVSRTLLVPSGRSWLPRHWRTALVAFVSGTTAREFVEFLEIRSARGTLPNSSRHADTKCHGEKSRKAGLLGLP